jgi:3D (Asp-Asp-Asp) domain-containing protein
MYSEFIPESEIAIKLNRDQEEIQIKIKEGGDSFRNMVIVIMAQNNKTIIDISRRLYISNFELQKIVSDIGGELRENK